MSLLILERLLMDWIVEQFTTPLNDGSVYVFYNRGYDRIKCLFWDKNGCVS